MKRSLLTPCRIGAVELNNRVVMAAMTTGLADTEGHLTEAMLPWFEARARGGIGLVTVGPAAIDGSDRRFRELAIHDDRVVPDLARLSRRLHAAGARCAIQIGGWHGDPRGGAAISPQAIEAAQIVACVAAHVAAACRARDAGFDMIELSADDGGLISRFLDPKANWRGDTHGGTLETGRGSSSRSCARSWLPCRGCPSSCGFGGGFQARRRRKRSCGSRAGPQLSVPPRSTSRAG